jgi:hypothetical protein
VPLGEFIEGALRQSLRRHRHLTSDGFITVGGGLQPGVNLEDRRQLFELSGF